MEVVRWRRRRSVQVESSGGGQVEKSRWRVQAENPGGESRWRIQVENPGRESRWRIQVENPGGESRWRRTREEVRSGGRGKHVSPSPMQASYCSSVGV